MIQITFVIEKRMNEIVYLEPDDEITGVIDRMKASNSFAIVLVMPRGSALAQSVVNLKLLKRSAEDLEKEVALVATDRITRNLASQVGITVYSKISEAEKARPVQSTTRQTSEENDTSPSGIKINTYSRYTGPDPELGERKHFGLGKSIEATIEAAAVEAEVDSETEAENPSALFRSKSIGSEAMVRSESPQEKVVNEINIEEDISPAKNLQVASVNTQKKEDAMAPRSFVRRSSAGKGKKVIALTVGVLLVVAVVSYFFVPYASASIQLKTEDYNKAVAVSVNRDTKAIDVANKLVPGTVLDLEKELTKSFPTTGQKDMGEKAHGKINLSNSYDQTAHSYRQGTKLSSGGKSFIADNDFSVGGAAASLVGGKLSLIPGDGSVSVTAENAGESYNLPTAANYTIDSAPPQIVGKGEQMTGGVTKIIKTVTDSDLAAAQSSLTDELTLQVKKAVEDDATKGGDVFSDGAFSSAIISIADSKNVDDEADSFDATLKIKGSALVYKEQDVRDLIIAAAKNDLGSKMLVNPEKSEVEYTVGDISKDFSALAVNATLKGRVSAKLSASDIQQKIRNKTKASAENILASNENIEKVELNISPKKLNRTPLLASRITVKFDYAK